ncbi:AEC family transporter [Halotalea alkalilenta]|uniref:Malate transporter n=1 Tax=Halotalea alkalilenta TaxID=376489 RepID=A0A172YER9_9GAMM|nr:AEC family transporter [Halotalea alkalilenta]ANF57771.1 malate transporter [Halotalea alkalilenta]
MSLLETLARTLDVTLPIFSMLMLGVVLKRWRWIDRPFIDTASALVFRGAMPVMIFLNTLEADLSAIEPWLPVYFAIATLATFLLSWLWALRWVERADRGAFVQGAFRGNGAILGLAFAGGMYGSYGLSVGALLIATLIPLYNALSVLVLSLYRPERRVSVGNILLGMAKNPLILSVFAAFCWRSLGLPMPSWVSTTGHYFASLTLPLALLCIGGTLSLAAFRDTGRATIEASLLKMVWLPLLSTLGAWACGFRGPELGMLFLYFASPSAAAGFIMAQSMGANARLAASVIALTTLISVVTITFGLFVIQLIG